MDPRMAAQGMIEPFEPGQVREVNGQKIVSYGTSSYGYDIAVPTNSRSSPTSTTRSSIEGLRPEFLRRHQEQCLHHSAEFLRAGAHGRVLPHSAQRADHLPGQVSDVRQPRGGCGHRRISADH